MLDGSGASLWNTPKLHPAWAALPVYHWTSREWRRILLAVRKQTRQWHNKLLAPCRTCRVDTDHKIIKSVSRYNRDVRTGIAYDSSYEIVECRGCGTLAFRSCESRSDDVDQDSKRPFETLGFYPGRYKDERERVAGSEALPAELGRIYTETLQALNKRQPVLCGIGVRAVIESVARDRNASGRDLSKKIDDLVARGDLTRQGAAVLHKLRVLGNKAAHEVKAHTTRELSLAIDVVDHLLQAVYILPELSKKTFK